MFSFVMQCHQFIFLSGKERHKTRGGKRKTSEPTPPHSTLRYGSDLRVSPLSTVLLPPSLLFPSLSLSIPKIGHAWYKFKSNRILKHVKGLTINSHYNQF